MIRVKLATALLKSAGIEFEFRVQRTTANATKDGRTLLRTLKLKDAIAKLRVIRLAQGDIGVVRLVTTLQQRSAPDGS